MKSIKRMVVMTMVLLAALSFARAETILMDPTTNNGDFQDGSVSQWSSSGQPGWSSTSPSSTYTKASNASAWEYNAHNDTQWINVYAGYVLTSDVIGQATDGMEYYLGAAMDAVVAAGTSTASLIATDGSTEVTIVSVSGPGYGRIDVTGGKGLALPWYDDTSAPVSGVDGWDLFVQYSYTDYASWGAVDDIRVTEVPEPATLGLLSMGGLGMFVRRKRK